MSVCKFLSNARGKRILPLIAIASLLGSGMAAGSLHAAGNEPTDADASSSRLVIPDCNDNLHGTGQVVVERANGAKRAMEMCNSLVQGDISATATALSAAIDAEEGMSKFYADPRMPELLSLRLDRTRTEVDTASVVDVRIQRLAALNYKIDALEHAMAGATLDR
jgi:hypothetical protein